MEKIRKFLVSDLFSVLLILASSVFVFTGNEIGGTILFAALIGLVMVLTDDLLPALQIILLTTCFAIRCKHSFDDFMQFVWIAPPIAILILSHFIIYRRKTEKFSPKNFTCFYGILFVSVAVTLGGLGIITAKEYFSSTSLFYILMLGFAVLVVYAYMGSTLRARENYAFSDKFAKVMVSIIFMLAICLAEEYISRWSELSGGFDILAFQWRNNASTMLMLAMPFAFYLSAKKFGWFFVGIFTYVLILFTGSRGGMLFGLVELGICFITMFILDRKHRPYIGIIFGFSLVVAFFLRHSIIDIVSYTTERLLDYDENKIRLGLYSRGIEDFLANPLFGRGLGYMGNSDIHNNAQFTLCWYHCSPVQVIGSFGLFGVAAYVTLLFLRFKTLVKNPTFFNIILFVSYIGLELMSFVNPGIFVPFPYLFLVTIYFVIMEKCNTDDDRAVLKLMKNKKYGEKQ